MKKLLISIFLFSIVSNACFAEIVVFNTKTNKYDNPTCSSAKKCTVNCIKIEKQQVNVKGGIPCKICGG